MLQTPPDCRFPGRPGRVPLLWALLTLLWCGARPEAAVGQVGWRFQVGSFLPATLTSPLTIRQRGETDLRWRARYASEALTPPITWTARIERRKDDGAWALEVSHHKLYVENAPSEVQAFSISHGMNVVGVARGWLRRRVALRAGLGAVLGHPENTVRGRTLSESGGLGRKGYYLTGPVASSAVALPVPLGAGLSLEVEGRATVARVVVPVEGGEASLRPVTLQLTVLLGWSSSP